MSLTDDASEFNWMLNNFVRKTPGVTDAVAVSSDGLLMANSNTLEPEGADQVAAIISGLVSLGEGTSRCLAFEELEQIIVTMDGGFLFVTAMGAVGCLGVVADLECEMGIVGYQMRLMVERAGKMLTPELVGELKSLVLAA
jgi:predicted regulator of Ras-like GTPase activity (Roadblock/LC7/MglB family)